ncbi:MAG: hypothetical protein ABIR24_14210 [Verrucomicrobiota bacterium]
MSVITFKAHYDGKQICLDEPIHLAPNTPLIVTVLPADAPETERSEWLAASQAAFARAYGEDEPDYSDALIRERPPKK